MRKNDMSFRFGEVGASVSFHHVESAKVGKWKSLDIDTETNNITLVFQNGEAMQIDIFRKKEKPCVVCGQVFKNCTCGTLDLNEIKETM
jgi:hypothetical protein